MKMINNHCNRIEIKRSMAGFTLVELMVGITVGMIVIAGAIFAFGTTVRTSSDTISSARLNQDVGAVTAILSGELERAGYIGCDPASAACWSGLGFETHYAVDPVDFNDEVWINAARDCILYVYNEDQDGQIDTTERRGFKLTNAGVLQMRTVGADGDEDDCAAGTWVDLTDTEVVTIDSLEFSVTGSRCLNANNDSYWTVTTTDVDEFPCESTSFAELTLTDSDGNTSTPAARGDLADGGNRLVEQKLVNVTLVAELTEDDSVSKSLATSIIVMNNRLYVEPIVP
ncbi:MAG: PilW family protein [bacterium]